MNCTAGYGIIFSYDINTGNYTKLRELDDSTGEEPMGDLLKVSENDGTAIEHTPNDSKPVIFPNPALNQITVQLANSSESMTAVVTDLAGRILLSNYTYQNDKFLFNIQSLSAGIYLVHLKQNGISCTGKFIKLN